MNEAQRTCPECQARPGWHAHLHASHIWTNTECLAYLTLNGDDCTCAATSEDSTEAMCQRLVCKHCGEVVHEDARGQWLSDYSQVCPAAPDDDEDGKGQPHEPENAYLAGRYTGAEGGSLPATNPERPLSAPCLICQVRPATANGECEDCTSSADRLCGGGPIMTRAELANHLAYGLDD